MALPPWKIWVDTGGTFTDCMAVTPEGTLTRLKVLSSSVLRLKISSAFRDGVTVAMPFASPVFLEGFTITYGGETRTVDHCNSDTHQLFVDRPFTTHHTADVIEISTGEEVPVFAARLLTGTGLKQSFPPLEMKLGSTRGTNALLERKGARTAFVVTQGFRDLLLIGTQQRPDLFSLAIHKNDPLYDHVVEVPERLAANGAVLVPLTAEHINDVIAALKKKKAASVAVALLNSYRNPRHEQQLAEALRDAGFQYVSCSHELSSQIKILSRAETAVANAYLDPIIDRYISAIRGVLVSASLKVMSSAGGLLEASDFRPKDSLLSGPAGGVIGALTKARQSGIDKILTFDMGGTSTDVSRCAGRPDYRFDCTVGNLKILSPSLAIETIAAGGGSICATDGLRFTVGPHSAGASPGPACYGAGGQLTITDVNLLLGRLDEDNFSIPLKPEAAEAALQQLVRSLPRKSAAALTKESVLESFIDIANEKMAEAIRKVSIQHGHDPKEYALLCFGGAGGQHACALAAMLQVKHILVPYDAGLLSAYGIGHAKLEAVAEKLVLQKFADVQPSLHKLFEALHHDALPNLAKNFPQGVPEVSSTKLIFLRLQGQETSLEIEFVNTEEIEQAFIAKYKSVYGHWLGDRAIEVESIRLIVSAGGETWQAPAAAPAAYTPHALRQKKIFMMGKWKQCPVYLWEHLQPGALIEGPALVTSKNSTTLVEDGWQFKLDQHNNAHVTRTAVVRKKAVASEEAQLELFTNRFTAIAQEMGTLLQRSSFSVNVKERLDFSCAVLDAAGNLVVNAPHIPVHLGSMGVCVRAVMKHIDMKEGDVVITNHPAYGGSHLPDITLIKPVFFKKQLLGFVANRAHHAEIGGKKPGSMPADAICLEEEGVVIAPTYLVKRGKPQWQAIEHLFTSAPYPTRLLQENLADLNGALAALNLGDHSLAACCQQYGADNVQHHMTLLRKHAATLLRKKISTLKSTILKAEETLDDGARLRVKVHKAGRKFVIDFTGSAGVHRGNLNATNAIVNSVVLYVLRLWVNEPVPLNEGLLEPVKLILPTGMLNPKFSRDNRKSPAVVGGNTEVSQRLTDTLLKVLGLAACSQGTMNNFLFGNPQFGYYETICGGVGAGPGFHGADAVHQHMTNTRITDPEILEHRYPVCLQLFEIRRGSGGKGKWNGGDGVVRSFVFNDTLDINFLSQHRTVAPFGMKGGQPGKTGEQYIVRASGKKEKLGGVDGATVCPGDKLTIKTPGGGGWGVQ